MLVYEMVLTGMQQNGGYGVMFIYWESKFHVSPLHPPSRSEIKELRIFSASLLNNLAHKRLSEGVTNCATIIALNISLRTSHPLSTLTMSLRLVMKATQE